MHDSTSGTKSIFVAGLYDEGSHDLAPPACGQTNLVSPSPGTRRESIVLSTRARIDRRDDVLQAQIDREDVLPALRFHGVEDRLLAARDHHGLRPRR